MKDSSRWLLIIALVALISVLSGNGFGWFSFGFHLGFFGKVVLVALAIWLIREKGCCKGSMFCSFGDTDESREEEKSNDSDG